MSYLKDLVWNTVATGDVSVVETQGAGIFYRILQVGSVIEVNWDNQIKGKGDKRGGFKTLKDAKDFVELDHYPHTMKPYVKGFEVIEQKVNSINEVNNKGKDMETLQGNTKKYSKEQVVDAIEMLSDICHSASVRGGWWHNLNTGEPLERNKLEMLMLAVSEIGEAVEGVRKGINDDHLPQYKMEDVEIADTFIRLFDYTKGHGLQVAESFFDKVLYNANRADHKPSNRIKDGGKKY